MLKSVLLFTIVIGLLIVVYQFINNNDGNSWLTSTQNSKALKHHDAAGYDFINCTKVKMNQEEIDIALGKLALLKIDNSSNLDSSPANCEVEWWDTDFPSEAIWFSLSSSRSIRQLATVKSGYLYYIYEVR